jgi:hypothetical protein
VAFFRLTQPVMNVGGVAPAFYFYSQQVPILVSGTLANQYIRVGTETYSYPPACRVIEFDFVSPFLKTVRLFRPPFKKLASKVKIALLLSND